MVVVVLFTRLCAGFADVGAQRANLCGVDATSRHEASRQAADGCAVDIVANALCHGADMFFGQARCSAMVASVGAVIAGIDAGLVLFM